MLDVEGALETLTSAGRLDEQQRLRFGSIEIAELLAFALASHRVLTRDWALYGECDPSLSGAQCLQFHREQSAIVVVYFEQLNYESLQESEAYGVTWR
ncbi:hypothetical protein GPALN_005987 [Globodera pallida]|nr:hypothetical protein GPALN_005987 [Globodera pallida]